MGLFGPPNVEKLAAKGDVKGLINALQYYGTDAVASGRAAEEAAGALGRLAPRSVEPLIAVLTDDQHPAWYHLRQGAACALGQTRDPRAVPSLMAALNDKRQEVRESAAVALERLGAVPADGEAAAQYWIVRGDWVRSAAVGPEAVGPLTAALNGWGSNASGVEQVVSALTAIGAPAVEPLCVVLRDGRPAERLGAAKALGRIGDARAVGSLIAALNDRETILCGAAAEALGQIGDAAAIEPLVAALQINDWSRSGVRPEAANALGRIGDARAVEPLIAARTADTIETRQAAAVAVSRIAVSPANRAELLEPLVLRFVADLSSRDGKERQFAGRALFTMYENGELPASLASKILAQRERIAAKHEDRTAHQDGAHWDRSSSAPASDCNEGAYHSHEDFMVTRPGALYTNRVDRKTHADTGGAGMTLPDLPVPSRPSE